MRLTHLVEGRVEGMTMNYQKPISCESLEAYGMEADLESTEARTKRRRWLIAGAVLVLGIVIATWFLMKNGDGATVAAGDDATQAQRHSGSPPVRAPTHGTH